MTLEDVFKMGYNSQLEFNFSRWLVLDNNQWKVYDHTYRVCRYSGNSLDDAIKELTKEVK